MPGYSTYAEMSPTGRFLWSQSGLIETASGTLLQGIERGDTTVTPEDIPPVWLGESHVAEVLLLKSDAATSKWIADRAVLIWNAKTGAKEGVALASDANTLAASPDGSQLAEGGKDRRVRIRNGKTLKIERTLRVHDGPVIAMAWHPTLPMLATTSEDYSVRLWDLRTGALVEEFRTTRNALAMRLKWSPDGRFLGVSYLTTSSNVKIYEPKACQEASR